MKVVSFFRLKEVRWVLAEADLERLQKRFPGVSVVSIEEEDRLPAALADADVFLGWLFPPEQFERASRLRWIQTASAGVEENLFPAMVASDVILTNAAGLHAVSIPEHVFGQILVLARNFHEAFRLQSRSQWDRFGVIAYAGGIRELAGANLLVLGAGAIGRNVARLGAALGMHVRVIRRDPSRPTPDAEEVRPPSELHEQLRWADAVVLAVPLTGQTRNLIGEPELRAMRSDAFLVNVARGEVVDDEALIAALRGGAIAGAALDVFSEEPLPAEHPFWSIPNLVLTPHVSGYTPRYFEKVLALFEDNLDRFLAGRPLRNVVDKRLGYARQED
jgi:phosphoglycerate dehydrogenase-like enzyme